MGAGGGAGTSIAWRSYLPALRRNLGCPLMVAEPTLLAQLEAFLCYPDQTREAQDNAVLTIGVAPLWEGPRSTAPTRSSAKARSW